MAGTITAQVKSGVSRRIEYNRPLADMTTFQIGGPADYFLSCESRSDVQRAADMCRHKGMSLRVIGGGSNLLIPDQGVRGMVIDISKLKALRICGERAVVDAGMKLTTLVAKLSRAGLSGIEGLAAIPGTVGGAIAMNAGGRYGEISDAVERIVVMTPEGELKQIEHDEVGFAYRTSKLEGGIVLEAYLKLKRMSAEPLISRVRELSEVKISSQPYKQRSAGCTFRNPEGCEHGAGKLIDMAGLKGARVGNAQISELHANFIVNLGGAKASDVDALTRMAQERVFGAYGVHLKREVKFWAVSPTK